MKLVKIQNSRNKYRGQSNKLGRECKERGGERRGQSKLQSGGEMVTLLIPDEKIIGPVADAAVDLVVNELELHLGEVHTIRGAGFAGIMIKRGAFSCDMIMTVRSRDTRAGRSAGGSLFEAWAAWKRLPVIELPNDLEHDSDHDSDHDLGQAEPTGPTTPLKHNSLLRPRRMGLFSFLRRSRRYFFHPGFLSVMEAETTGGSSETSGTSVSNETSVTNTGVCLDLEHSALKEWDGKRPLMGVFLGPTSPKTVVPDEIPRWLAFLARACDRSIYEDKSQVVLFYQGEEGRRAARIFQGFSRIKPMVVHVDPLVFSDRVKLLRLCKSVVVTGRAGEIVSVASGVPPVCYGYESQLSFPGEGVLSWPLTTDPDFESARSTGEDPVHVIRAAGADSEIRQKISDELSRARAETKAELRRWVRRLLVREGFGGCLVND